MISKDKDKIIFVRQYFARRIKVSFILGTIAKQLVLGLLVSLLSFCFHNVTRELSKMKVEQSVRLLPGKTIWFAFCMGVNNIESYKIIMLIEKYKVREREWGTQRKMEA